MQSARIHPPELRDVGALEITQVVRGDTFAGVERYVCAVANALAERGHQVKVVGGDSRMGGELHNDVSHARADSFFRVFTTLLSGETSSLGARSHDCRRSGGSSGLRVASNPNRVNAAFPASPWSQGSSAVE